MDNQADSAATRSQSIGKAFFEKRTNEYGVIEEVRAGGRVVLNIAGSRQVVTLRDLNRYWVPDEDYTDSELRGMLNSPGLTDSARDSIDCVLENRDRAARGLEPL